MTPSSYKQRVKQTPERGVDGLGHLQPRMWGSGAPCGVVKILICVGERLLCSSRSSMLFSLGIRCWETPGAFSAMAMAKESFAASRSSLLVLLAPSSAVNVLTAAVEAREAAVLPSFWCTLCLRPDRPQQRLLISDNPSVGSVIFCMSL